MNQNYFQQYYVQTITLRWLNVYQTCLHIYQQENNPLTIINIANHQQNDPHLMQLAQQFPMIFPIKIINNINIICYPDEALPIEKNQWRIAIPPTMIQVVIIHWYHYLVLGHPGSQRLYDTINMQDFTTQDYQRYVNNINALTIAQW